MTKKEFLSELKNALAGEVPESEIRQHIDYYDLWLTNKAKTIGEESATEELGSPLLIAKTLINDYKMQHRTNLQYDYNAGAESSSGASNSGSQNYGSAGSESNNSGRYTASYDFNPGNSSGNSSAGSSSSGANSNYGNYGGSYSNGNGSGAFYSTDDDYEDADNNRKNKTHFIINGKTVNSVWARLGCLGCAILICLILFVVANAIIKIVFPIIIVAVLIFMAISLFRGN